MRFQVIIYNIGIKVYRAGIWVGSFFSIKARKWQSGRHQIFRLIANSMSANTQSIWMHCASVGEFEQGRPLLEMMKSRFPEMEIVLTFFSPSGYELRKNYNGVDHVFYLPLDTKQNSKEFISLIQPKMVVFVKYEFWFHYLNTLHKLGIPIFLISAIFRPDQIFFKWYGSLFRKLLTYYTHCFVQDEQSRQLLEKTGVSNATIAPDTRFDRVFQISKNVEDLPIVKEFRSNNRILICGSSWPEDEDILISFINEHKFDDVKFIIAPHELVKTKIHHLAKTIRRNTILYSEAAIGNVADKEVLIIDNIGMLSSLYKYGDLAMIGGGFGAGIHNILEPAVFGVPVIFGPNHKKFKEAVDLLDLEGAFTISDISEFFRVANNLFKNQEQLEKATLICKNYVEDNTGGAAIIFDMLQNRIDVKINS